MLILQLTPAQATLVRHEGLPIELKPSRVQARLDPDDVAGVLDRLDVLRALDHSAAAEGLARTIRIARGGGHV